MRTSSRELYVELPGFAFNTTAPHDRERSWHGPEPQGSDHAALSLASRWELFQEYAERGLTFSMRRTLGMTQLMRKEVLANERVPCHDPLRLRCMSRKQLQQALYAYFRRDKDRAEIRLLSRTKLAFALRHEWQQAEAEARKRVPRTQLEDELLARLDPNADQGRGAILVSGFRGVGKTSLVNRVIERLAGRPVYPCGTPKDRAVPDGSMDNRDRRLVDVRLNLAQDDLDEGAILRLVAIELHRELLKLDKDPWYVLFKRYLYRPLILCAMVFVCCVAMLKACAWEWLWHALSGVDWHSARVVGGTMLVFLVPLVAATLMARYEYARPDKPGERALLIPIRRRLERLITLIHAHTTTEAGGEVQFPVLPLKLGGKTQESRGKAEPKEIELELVSILEQISRMDPRTAIIFIIDELDKLVPFGDRGIAERAEEDPTTTIPLGETTPGFKGYENEAIRKRQEKIGALLANLKHFLGVAHAKFVFIGGRELYDATLADVSNRDAFFGSIFSHVVYVPSFLKGSHHSDKGKVHGLTVNTEQFVVRSMLHADGAIDRTGDVSLEQLLHQWLKVAPSGTFVEDSDYSGEVAYAYAALQELINYLAFRSNGVPKRLAQLYERMVVKRSYAQLRKLPQVEPGAIVLPHVPPSVGTNEHEERYYLRITPESRFAFTLLSSIYRPFLSVYARYYARLNDKQLVALTYLMDHILKFHPVSFSFFNLELAPETIAVNKVPELRKFMNDVLMLLTGQHLRKVDNGLFDFQFRSKTYNELAYLSKVSEPDAAALNFTLDESLPVKRHFYRRLYHLIKLGEKPEGGQELRVLERVADLHARLGDLHFLDGEYEESLAQYRAAAKHYAPKGMAIARKEKSMLVDNETRPGIQENFSIERFHEYLKLTLRQIHCLEKMKAMDDAMLLSGALSRTILDYLENARDGVGARSSWRLMMIGIMAKPALIEKLARSGLTTVDIVDAIRMSELVIPKGTEKPSSWMLANLNLQLGMVLHFRGRPLLIKHGSASEQGVEPEVRIPISEARPLGWTANEAYWLALHRVLELDVVVDMPKMVSQIMQHLEPSEPRLLDDQPPRLDLPKIEMIGNLLGKYADTELYGDLGDKGEPWEAASFNGSLTEDQGACPSLLRSKYGGLIGIMLLAARAHLKAGRIDPAVFQVIKVLNILNHAEKPKEANDTTAYEKILQEVKRLIQVARELVHANNQRSEQPITRSWRARLSKASSSPENGAFDALRAKDLELGMVPYRSELIELDVLLYEWRLRNEPASAIAEDEDFVSFKKSAELASCVQHVRGRGMLLASRFNWKRMKEVLEVQPAHDSSGKHEILDLMRSKVNKANEAESVRELVKQGIQATVDLITIAERIGLNFVWNHTLLAKAYTYLGNWCSVLQHMESGVKATLVDELTRELGARFHSRLWPDMHYTIALEHYQKAVEMHDRGSSYRRVMDDMFMVEDDYNDNVYHFACALERWTIQSRKGFKNAMEHVRKELAKAQNTVEQSTN